MTPERWREVTRIYGAIVARPVEARAAAVEELCGADGELRTEVESLLAQENTSGVLDRPVTARPSLLNVAMGLPPGTQIGTFRIEELLGVGGMGEVYRARDTKLNRDVAIKILPPAFAADPERLARFKREAQVLASLNHPNIAAIYGLEGQEGPSGSIAIVMELVDGPTLADRIKRGPLPMDEALAVARQIAEALEAAHEQGIVHRDMKPSNIKVRDDGTVKVLDFGLAKIAESGGAGGSGASGRANLTNSPTITTPAMTAAGIILGTAAYMSPEQAKGKPADKRSDIWAFGCVVYELLTGKRTFDGEDVSDTLAAILRDEPDWTVLPGTLPPAVGALIRACLNKDRRRRIGDASTIRFVLDEFSAASPPLSSAAGAPARRWAISLASLLVVTVLLVAILVSTWRVAPPPASGVARFPIALPPAHAFESNGLRALTISPDGAMIVYAAQTSDDGGTSRLYVRSMPELAAKPIPGTDARGDLGDPIFSPDGRSLVYYSGATARGRYGQAKGVLKRIDANGGPTMTLCNISLPLGMTWAGNAILVAQAARGIFRVPDMGGEPELVVSVAEGEIARQPQLLPDGRTVLFTLARAALAETDPFSELNPVEESWDSADIVAESLVTHERRTLVQGGSDAVYLPSGHLVYAVAGTLRAVPFNASRMEVTGPPVPVVEGVARSRFGPRIRTGAAHYSIARTGALAFVPGPMRPYSSLRNVAIISRTGEAEALKINPAWYEFPRVSPDGKQLAVGVNDGKDANVWVYDLSQSIQIRQLTSGGKNRYPVWSPDSRTIAFQSDRGADLAIWSQPADGLGPATRLTTPERGTAHIPDAWSSTHLLFDVSTQSGFSLWALWTREGKVAPFGQIASTLVPPAADVSPDGRWVVYQAGDDVGVPGSRILVQPIPPTGVPFPIGPGAAPRWSADGTRLFYGLAGRIYAVPIHTRPVFGLGTPVLVADTRLGGGTSSRSPSPAERRGSFSIAPNGAVFNLVEETPSATGAARNIEVVLNWSEELRRLVPTN